MKKLALFSHGKDSEPWNEKNLCLAEVAKQQAYAVESIDYRNTNNPSERLKMLLAFDLSAYQNVVLIGSSMGGYISTVASPIIKPQGLFLLAPAFYLRGYPETEFQPPVNTFVVHGWQDEIVPVENAWRFSQKHRCHLQLLDADHRLISVLPEIEILFASFLQRINQVV
jgi:alpha/beta superfamily hydrolase